jgi:murein DD-endopeptidase MepM/ murein hydrolase activator NlpD
VIALSGNSGRSTAPHLHYEVRRAGKMLDPMQLIPKDSRNGNLC